MERGQALDGMTALPWSTWSRWSRASAHRHLRCQFLHDPFTKRDFLHPICALAPKERREAPNNRCDFSQW
jgi:hypothetical protein